ncbi:MAG: hypothetical protein NTZ80_02250 [Patescibacteria group bacterium]|nr:hypothetical protein [Patescibacteria group bacterium]
MQQICRQTGKTFVVSEAEKKYCADNDLPMPTIHPNERMRILCLFRNRQYLYNSICDYSKKPILSYIPPEKNLKVYEVDIWNSDVWDGLEYGRDFDFNRPFFEQFADMLREMPWPNLSVQKHTLENSDYCNGVSQQRNCYLVFGGVDGEDCMFCKIIYRVKNLIDCISAYDSELCYECASIKGCHNLKFSEYCHDCADSYFLYNCQGCNDCFGCANLYKKEYCFYNQQLSKDDYKKRMSEIDIGSYKVLVSEQAKWASVKESLAVKHLQGKNNENSSGNFLNNTKNAQNCFMVNSAEDMEYCININEAKSCLFYFAFGNVSELIYNCSSVGTNGYNTKFSAECFPNPNNLEYCMFACLGCSNCFGCCGLKKKEYCIFNKQYNPVEYSDLRQRIISHMKKTPLHQDYAGQACEWGQFFPASFVPFYYNQSEAQDFFPLAKEEVLARGLDWKDDEVESFASIYQIPDHIRDVQDDILQAVLKCTVSGKKYRIIKQELDYYRQNNLPIPRVSPFERIKEKSKILEFKDLQEIACSKCGQPVQTVYKRGQRKIYCEKCYQEEIY